jgi:hypothetical protein
MVAGHYVSMKNTRWLDSECKTTYAFGVTQIPTKRRVRWARNADECVFVLSGSEALEFDGRDVVIISEESTKPVQESTTGFNIPHEITGIRELSVCTMDAAITFDGKFPADVLSFGTDSKKRSADDMPGLMREISILPTRMTTMIEEWDPAFVPTCKSVLATQRGGLLFGPYRRNQCSLCKYCICKQNDHGSMETRL